MVRERFRRIGGRGFGTLEMVVVVAVLGVVAATAAPSLLAAWRASAFAAGVGELSAALSRARHLAIAENTSVCVQPAGVGVRLRTRGCAGAVWTGPGTDPSGLIRLSGDLDVAGEGAIVFTHLGGAVPAGTFTLSDRVTGRARRVVVASTGQVSAP